MTDEVDRGPREWRDKFGCPTVRRGKLVIPRNDGLDKRTTARKDILLELYLSPSF